MVDERLHRALHLPPGRRRDLAVVDHDRTLLRHLLQALPDDPVGLAHLLHADEIPRVAVAGEADRYVEVHAVIDVVRSEEHTSELQSLMRLSYAAFCLKK